MSNALTRLTVLRTANGQGKGALGQRSSEATVFFRGNALPLSKALTRLTVLGTIDFPRFRGTVQAL